MTALQPIPRLPAQAQTRAAAWFGTLLRAVRSDDAAAVAVTQRELRSPGIEVAPMPPRGAPMKRRRFAPQGQNWPHPALGTMWIGGATGASMRARFWAQCPGRNGARR